MTKKEERLIKIKCLSVWQNYFGYINSSSELFKLERNIDDGRRTQFLFSNELYTNNLILNHENYSIYMCQTTDLTDNYVSLLNGSQ